MTLADANLGGGLIGGALIGVASLVLLALNGRIAGVSGVLGGIFLAGPLRERLWRMAFVAGLIAGAGIYGALRGGLPLHFQAHGTLLLVAGLLVGIGTRLGSGCTSGHGVCGLARRSPRSLVATVTFMTAAVATVFLVQRVLS